MERVKYKVQVKRGKRRGGYWIATVPALPSDAPRIETRLLANVAPDMIVGIAEYLGVPATQVEVDVPNPGRADRTPLRDRVTAGAVQLGGGGVLLSGVYLAAGLAATLIAAGIGVVAVATGKEAGWL